MENSERLIFHIDVNSAFLSWESARRVKNGEQDLREIPACIGGDASKRTGVVLAKSIPAKKLGVTTGEPISMALRKCPSLVTAKPDFKLYDKCSKAFMDICREYAPKLEKYSIDECFLDMSGTKLIYPNPIKTAFEIKEKIKNELGFTVNVGIGSNKLLAKMAGDFEKPDKVHTLFKSEIKEKMWVLPVGDLIGVGKMTKEKLEKSYIFTIGDLAQKPLKSIQRIVGVKLGEQIHQYANGIDKSQVTEGEPIAKGYSVATTLEENVESYEIGEKILLSLCDSVATRLRADDARTFCVSVNIRSISFNNKSHQKKLTSSTDVTDDIFAIAKTLLHQMWNGHSPLRLMGVSLTDITYDGSEQLSFDSIKSDEKAHKIDKTVDNLRNQFGMDSIKRGTLLNQHQNIGKKYKAQLENKNKTD